MALAALVPPQSTFLATLAVVNAELGLDGSQDAVLYGLIDRASTAIARECGRPYVGFGTFQETLKGSGSQILGVTCAPVLQVLQVLQDTEVVNPADPAQGYSVEDAESGSLFRACEWGQTVALLSWGSEAYGSRYILPGGTNALRYTVTYQAGYTLPGDPLPTPPTPFVGQWIGYGSPGQPGVQQGALLAITSGTLAVGQVVLLDTGGSQEPVALSAVAGPANGAYTCSFITLLPHTLPVAVSTPPVPAGTLSPFSPPRLPGAVEQACLLTVKSWYFARQRDLTVKQQRSNEQEQTYDLGAFTKELPAAALGLLRDFRRVA